LQTGGFLAFRAGCIPRIDRADRPCRSLLGLGARASVFCPAWGHSFCILSAGKPEGLPPSLAGGVAVRGTAWGQSFCVLSEEKAEGLTPEPRRRCGGVRVHTGGTRRASNVPAPRPGIARSPSPPSASCSPAPGMPTGPLSFRNEFQKSGSKENL
jgi:hypothetical protein